MLIFVRLFVCYLFVPTVLTFFYVFINAIFYNEVEHAHLHPSDITQSKFERNTLIIFYSRLRLCTISKKFIVSLTIFKITLALPI